MGQQQSSPDAPVQPRDGIAHRLAILNAVTSAISETLDLPQLLDHAIGTVIDITGVDGVAVFLHDESAGRPVLADHRGLSLPVVTQFGEEAEAMLTALARDPATPILERDLSRVPHGSALSEAGIRSFLAIPLHARRRGLGVLVALSRGQPGIAAPDVALLAAMARQVGMAIERARLYERERRRAQQLETISEVGRRLGAILNEQELLPQVVHYVSEHLGYDSAALLLLDAAGELVVQAASGLGQEAIAGYRVPVNDRSIVGWVQGQGQPLLANDVSQEPRYHPGRLSPDICRAELAVPIHVAGRALGVLDVQSAHLNAFLDSDLSALQTLAGQIGVAIENARLFEDSQRALQRTRALQELTTAVNASLDLRSTLERALDVAMSVFEADRAGVYLVAPDNDRIYCPASRNLSEEYLSAVDAFYRGAPRAARAMSERSLYVEDAARQPLAPELLDASRREGFHSMLFLPLRTGGELQGMFVLYHDRIRHYSREETELAQTFADHAAIAIGHSRLYQDTQQALERTRAFQEVTTAVSASLDLRSTLERAMDAAMAVFEADRAGVYLVDPDTDRVTCAAARNLSPEYREAVENTHFAVRPVMALMSDRPVYVEDAAAAPLVDALAGAIRREGFRSQLLLPLRHGAELRGMFALYHDQTRRYSPNDIGLAQTFADQATIAIEHARLFEGEQRARQHAAMILEATRTITASLQLDDVLLKAASCIAAALGRQSCGIWLLDEERGALVPWCCAYLDEGCDDTAEFRKLTPIILDETPRLRELLDHRQPVIVDTRGQGMELEAAGAPFETCLALPLVARDRVVGWATVSEAGYPFEAPAVDLAAAIANSAALAVENARLYEQSRRLAVSEERNRLARELHDSVTQSLFSMTLISQALPRILERDQEQARERIDRLNELARGALAEMRALIFELRPAALEEEGLTAALGRHAAAFQSREGIAVDLGIEGERRLPGAVEEGIFRVAQESLNNVAKHAHARRVQVRLVIEDGAAALTVADDGAGFDATSSPAGSATMGMTSMRERAALLGGSFSVESGPGAGTVVVLRVPLPPAQREVN